MHLPSILLAALPALALADTTATNPLTTVTCTSTMKMTKTIYITRVPTTTSYSSNSTTSYMPTATQVTTLPTGTGGPKSGAGVLDAGKVAFAGLAGMLVVAMM